MLAALCLLLGYANVARADGVATPPPDGGARTAPDARDGTAPLPIPAHSLARLGSIRVGEIRVEGSSIFTPLELSAMTAAYTNRVVSLEELHSLRHALSRAYVERGYVSSGVVIPDQRVDEGLLVMRAVEGELTDVEVLGNRRFRNGAIARRVQRHVGTPLDIADLQTSLRLLQEEPLIERVNAQLLPGAAPGESRLRLAITERRALELDVAAGNDRSATVGEDRGIVGLTYRGLIGNGDVLSGRFGFTEGVADNTLAWRVPLGAGGTALDLLLVDQQADIVEERFAAIDIESELRSWSLTASRPFFRDGDRSLTGFVGFEHKRSESTLLGLPFSFSPGDIEGRARGSAVSVGAEWVRRGARQALAVRGTLQIGVDALDATTNTSAPDTRFTAWLGQVQYVRTLPWRDGRLLVRGLVQAARDPLLAMYKLPVGGRYSVRGYRENLFVRDNGATVSAEYQFPPFVNDAGRARGSFRLALFADYGVSWDEDDALVTAGESRIASVGLGLLWDPLPGLHTEVYWGADLDEQVDAGDALQDRGVHYGLSFRKLL